ncbi:MAG: hypothetical protein ABIJ97_07715 [Bacteroidota bacterium]
MKTKVRLPVGEAKVVLPVGVVITFLHLAFITCVICYQIGKASKK